MYFVALKLSFVISRLWMLSYYIEKWVRRSGFDSRCRCTFLVSSMPPETQSSYRNCSLLSARYDPHPISQVFLGWPFVFITYVRREFLEPYPTSPYICTSYCLIKIGDNIARMSTALHEVFHVSPRYTVADIEMLRQPYDFLYILLFTNHPIIKCGWMFSEIRTLYKR